MPDNIYRLVTSYAQAANLDFWEVVFRRACQKKQFDICIDDFESIYCTKTIYNYIEQACLDEGPLARNSKGKFSFKHGLTAFEDDNRHLCIEKPVSYIDNDVYVALGKSLQPKRLINCLLYERARELGFPSFADLSKNLEERPFRFTYADLKRLVDSFVGKGVNSNEFPKAVNWLARPHVLILKIEEPAKFPSVKYDVPIVFRLKTEHLSALPYVGDPPIQIGFEVILKDVVPSLWRTYRTMVRRYGIEATSERIIGPLPLYPSAVKIAESLIGYNTFFTNRLTLESDVLLFMFKLLEQMDKDGILTLKEKHGEGDSLSVFLQLNKDTERLRDVNNLMNPSDSGQNSSSDIDDLEMVGNESTFKKARREYWFAQREKQLRDQMLLEYKRDPVRAEAAVSIGARLHFVPIMCQDLFSALGKWYDRVPPYKYDAFRDFAVEWGIKNKGAFNSKKLIDAYYSRNESPRWRLSISYASLNPEAGPVSQRVHTPKVLEDIEEARIERLFQLKNYETADLENVFVETTITDYSHNIIFNDVQPVYRIGKDYITPYPDITEELRRSVPPLHVTFRVSKPTPQLQLFIRIQYRIGQ